MRRLASAVLILAVAGCSDLLSGGRRDVTLSVADVVVPESSSTAGPLTVVITVMTGGCLRFERFAISRTSNSATIETQGTDGRTDAICTRELKLEKKTVSLTGPFAFPFTVTATQPNGSSLVRTVAAQAIP